MGKYNKSCMARGIKAYKATVSIIRERASFKMSPAAFPVLNIWCVAIAHDYILEVKK